MGMHSDCDNRILDLLVIAPDSRGFCDSNGTCAFHCARGAFTCTWMTYVYSVGRQACFK